MKIVTVQLTVVAVYEKLHKIMLPLCAPVIRGYKFPKGSYVQVKA